MPEDSRCGQRGLSIWWFIQRCLNQRWWFNRCWYHRPSKACRGKRKTSKRTRRTWKHRMRRTQGNGLDSSSVTCGSASRLGAAAAVRERWRHQLAEQPMTKPVVQLAGLVAEGDLDRSDIVVLARVTMLWEEFKFFKAWDKQGGNQRWFNQRWWFNQWWFNRRWYHRPS